MHEITQEELSALLSAILAFAFILTVFILVIRNARPGMTMRKFIFLFALMTMHSYCGATKSGDRQRAMSAVRGLLRLNAPQSLALSQSEKLSRPEFCDHEVSASVGFKHEPGCSVMSVSIAAQCVNSSSNSFEIFFENDASDNAKVDVMIGFEDGAWMCAAGDACVSEEGCVPVPAGEFELRIDLVLGKDGIVAECRATAGGARIPLLEEAIRSSRPRDWRRLTVCSRNDDGEQPWIGADTQLAGLVISIK